MAGPTVDAPGFTVANLQWNPIGFPSLTFLITYNGPDLAVTVRYEAASVEGKMFAGALSGSYMKGAPTSASIVFDPGTSGVKSVKFTA